MGDLIDRDKIYKAVYDLACASAGVIDGICEDYAYGLREAAHMIEEAPAVDAVPMEYHETCMEMEVKKRILAEKTNRQIIENYVPVVHGRWIPRNDEWFDFYQCSACHVHFWTMRAAYCPNCGAKLDGEMNAK